MFLSTAWFFGTNFFAAQNQTIKTLFSMDFFPSSSWRPAPVVEDVCGRLIQLSFTKILSSKSERGGARLHKNLLILHLLKRARGHQRQAPPSELAALSPTLTFAAQEEAVEGGEARDFPLHELQLVGEEAAALVDDAEVEEELAVGAEAPLPFHPQGSWEAQSSAGAYGHYESPPCDLGLPQAPSEASTSGGGKDCGSDSSGYDSGPSDEDDSAPSSPESPDPDQPLSFDPVSPRKRKLLAFPSAEGSGDKRPCFSPAVPQSQGLTPFHPAFESPFPLGQAAQPPPSPPVAHLHRLISVFNSVDMLDA